MNVRVLYFAQARELADCAEEVLEVPAGSTIGRLRELLAERHAALAGLLESSLLAVNDAYVDDDYVPADGNEVAVIPPVSGGEPHAAGSIIAPLFRSTMTERRCENSGDSIIASCGG